LIARLLTHYSKKRETRSDLFIYYLIELVEGEGPNCSDITSTCSNF
jgi:hypothetical protein